MGKTDLMIIGGFLGAGKTTTILKIAKHLVDSGKKIGIVTNDQGSELVDTNFLVKAGLPVLEVTGGCFCCNFDEFTKKVEELSESLMPDVVLAEPVGSCTDLVATIFKPIQQNYTKKFSLSPLTIVADPKRVKKLMMEKDSPFPSEINYLFEKQLEEADIIALNKTDKLKNNEIEAMLDFLKTRFKGIEIIPISAAEDLGVKNLISLVYNIESVQKPSLNIDYEVYAKAEEMLGWFNSTSLLRSEIPHDANGFIDELIDGIRYVLKDENIEIAHLKVYEVSSENYAKASLTGIFDDVDFSSRMESKVSCGSLIINARINADPGILELVITGVLNDVCLRWNIELKDYQVQCFKPSKPNPKYRMN